MSSPNGRGRGSRSRGKTLGRSGGGSSRKSSGGLARGLARWWPVLVGIVIAPFAVRAVDYLTFLGPWYARLVTPWAFLLQGRSLGLPTNWGDHVVEALMYLQFPLYGLFLVMLQKRLSFGTAFGLLLVLHGLAYGALFLLLTS